MTNGHMTCITLHRVRQRVNPDGRAPAHPHHNSPAAMGPPARKRSGLLERLVRGVEHAEILGILQLLEPWSRGGGERCVRGACRQWPFRWCRIAARWSRSRLVVQQSALDELLHLLPRKFDGGV